MKQNFIIPLITVILLSTISLCEEIRAKDVAFLSDSKHARDDPSIIHEDWIFHDDGEGVNIMHSGDEAIWSRTRFTPILDFALMIISLQVSNPNGIDNA